MIKKTFPRFGIKKISFTLLGTAMLIGTISNAQSITPQSVNSGGTKMSQSNGSLSFAVGELVVLSQIDSDGNTLGGGFAAGAAITTASIQEPNSEILDIKVFPNPTTELVSVQINHSTLEQMVISVSDLQGKELFNGKYAGISNTIGINTALYAPGTYVLSIRNTTNEVIGTYKIIKQ